MLTQYVNNVDKTPKWACTGGLLADEKASNACHRWLIVLLVAAIAAIVGVLSNKGAAHPLTDFSVFGYHLTGSTGTLFLFGIAVGAVASLGICLLLAGTRLTASRAADAQHAAPRFQRRRRRARARNAVRSPVIGPPVRQLTLRR